MCHIRKLIFYFFLINFLALTKLLIAGGRTTKARLGEVEILDLDPSHRNVTCKNFPELPIQLEGPVGHLFKGSTPVVCGGFGSVNGSSTPKSESVVGSMTTLPESRFGSLCECFAFFNGSWNPSSQMRECRLFAASIPMNSKYNYKNVDDDDDDDDDENDEGDDDDFEDGKEDEKLFVTGGISLIGNKMLSSVEVFDGNHFEIDGKLTLPMTGNCLFIF